MKFAWPNKALSGWCWLWTALILVMLSTMPAVSQSIRTIEDVNTNEIRPEREPGSVSTTGVRPPVAGDELLEGYQVQGQSGTAFGGFLHQDAGTLHDLPDGARYPSAMSDGAVQLEMRSGVFGRPIAKIETDYDFGGVIEPPEVLDQSGLPIADYYLSKPVNANESNVRFYYSPHADKVFATYAGRVSVVWQAAHNANERKRVSYQISTSPAKPERHIFWTEGKFTGPPVVIPTSLVREVKFLYNTDVPESVRTPVALPWREGRVDHETASDRVRYKTIFRDELGNIRAYNETGRILVEYLGPKPDAESPAQHLGYEIVNIVDELPPKTMKVDIGDKVPHFPELDAQGNEIQLEGIVDAGGEPAGDGHFLYRHDFLDGKLHDFYAIRETKPGIETFEGLKQTSTEAVIYWQERGVLNRLWPKQHIAYVFEWPALPENWRDLSSTDAKYSVYTRPNSGTPDGAVQSEATRIALDPSSHPHLQYQDDIKGVIAEIDLATTTFATTLTPKSPTNRALIRYTKDDAIWFERVFSQLDPYDWDPLPLVTKAVTQAPDARDQVHTGFADIYDVVVTDVTDPRSEKVLVVGKDYTVDAMTGVVSLIDHAWVVTTMPLGELSADATFGANIAGNSSDKADTEGNDWDIKSISLHAGSDPTPMLVVEMDPSQFGTHVTGATGHKNWEFANGIWSYAGNEAQSDSFLFIHFENPKDADVTLKLVHRYDNQFGFDGGVFNLVVLPFGDQNTEGRHSRKPLPAQSTNGYTGAFGAWEGASRWGFTGKGGDADFRLPTQVRVDLKIPPTTPFGSVPKDGSADIAARMAPGKIKADAFGEGDKGVHIGYIDPTEGVAYNAPAYVDPFAAGFDEAAKKAIIPVNNLPGQDKLSVWWFRKNAPPEAGKFTPTYWPSFPQRYQLQWPENPDVIDLASNAGSGALTGPEVSATIYRQNEPGTEDAPKPGFNPNEEHAIMANGTAWALRDDLNIPDQSSDPYVLLDFTGADGRPAMRAFHVIRGEFVYDAVAGTPLQAPMPLPLFLDKPLTADGKLADYEVQGVQDIIVSDNYDRDAAFRHY